jgi:hypothetical protein
MVQDRKQAESIPKEWVEEVRRRVEAGREFQEALKEMLATNAEPLVLWQR